jgi:hypothetical protein
MSKLARLSGAAATMGRQEAEEMSLARWAEGAGTLAAPCAEEVTALLALVLTLVEVETGTVLPASGLASASALLEVARATVLPALVSASALVEVATGTVVGEETPA